jgi:hypothetical protein
MGVMKNAREVEDIHHAAEQDEITAIGRPDDPLYVRVGGSLDCRKDLGISKMIHGVSS